MQTLIHTKQSKIDKHLALALSFVFVGSVQAACAQVQELSAGPAGQLYPGALGVEQDSLLPPEVVPVDPAVAARMAQKQAAAVSQFDTAQTENVPGLVNETAANNPYAQYKQLKNAMNNSLLGQAPMPKYTGNIEQLAKINANVAGQNPYLVPAGTNPVLNQAAQNLAEQNMVAVNAPVASGPGFGQSQTLTGGSTIQPQQQNTRRGGFSNAFGSMYGILTIPSQFLGPGIGFGGLAGGRF